MKSNEGKIPIIKSIKIRELYYSLTYELQANETNDENAGKLIILYGNNGAGKTTILNMVYHLLDPEPFGGHRSYLGKIPFLDFKVLLSNNWTIRAFRESITEPGPYHVAIYEKEKSPFVDWLWMPSKQDRTDEVDIEYDKLCTLLADLKLSFHYLRDSRRLEGRKDSELIVRERFIRQAALDKGAFLVEEDDDDLDQEYFPVENLKDSIDRALQWFRTQALTGTNVGFTSVNSIYKDIIKRLITYGELKESSESKTISTLITQLENLQTRNQGFSKYGLTSELDLNEIIKLMKNTSNTYADMLNTVMSPYLEGLQARLDALQELQKIMASFESLLADFYFEKFVQIHVEKGLKISTDTGYNLKPTALSSGEKQLLLLLCHAISSRKKGTIFIIDEPEISLNVIWQRKLIPALLSCMSGTQFQLLIATHSVELITQFRDFVTPLENIS